MIPTVPEHAPFSSEQRAWLNGFLAGLFSVQELDAVQNPHSGSEDQNGRQSGPSVSILYGSQTGTAEGLARKAYKLLAQQHLSPSVHVLNDIELSVLREMQRVLIIISTHGDGEMPDNAQAFWERLMGQDAPRLDDVAYSVLALGDSSYVDFCHAGRCLDARLEGLGAQRLHPRIDCDVDVDEPFQQWINVVVDAIRGRVIDAAMPDLHVRAA